MKKIFIILIAFVFTSCATLNELKVIYPVETLYGIDFNPFTKKGFLITPEKYTGAYESIGMINFTAKPGAQFKTSGLKPNPFYKEGGTEQRYVENFEWAVDSIAFSEVLNKVYDICVGMGADALVNFQNEITLDPYSGIKNPVTITGYRITGFAIKRKDK
jgi:hypothetical protein